MGRKHGGALRWQMPHLVDPPLERPQCRSWLARPSLVASTHTWVMSLLRDATSDDLPRLQEIFRRSSLSNEGDCAALVDHPEALFFPPASLSKGRVRVAIIEGDLIVGFATTLAKVGFLELDDLFTDPDWKRHGWPLRLLTTPSPSRRPSASPVSPSSQTRTLRHSTAASDSSPADTPQLSSARPCGCTSRSPTSRSRSGGAPTTQERASRARASTASSFAWFDPFERSKRSGSILARCVCGAS
jgi:hypothetical protein